MKKLITLFIIAITILIAYSCCNASGQSHKETSALYRSPHGDCIRCIRIHGRIVYFVETTDGRIQSISVI